LAAVVPPFHPILSRYPLVSFPGGKSQKKDTASIGARLDIPVFSKYFSWNTYIICYYLKSWFISLP